MAEQITLVRRRGIPEFRLPAVRQPAALSAVYKQLKDR